MPAAPTTRWRDDNMPTTRTREETAPMDTSPTKKRTGTVPAKLSNINNKMRWAEARPDRRHRHQSSGRDRRTSTNNRSRNLHEQGELSQDIQQRDTTRTNPEPVPEMPTSTKIPAGQFMDHEDRVRKPAKTADRAQQRQAEREEARVRTHAKQRDQAPTIPEPTTKFPASQYMDHEDRRRKPATTADRRQRRKSERGEARDKVQSKGRQKQTLLEKLAGPLLIPGLPRSRRTSPERGDGPAAVRGEDKNFKH